MVHLLHRTKRMGAAAATFAAVATLAALASGAATAGAAPTSLLGGGATSGTVDTSLPLGQTCNSGGTYTFGQVLLDGAAHDSSGNTAGQIAANNVFGGTAPAGFSPASPIKGVFCPDGAENILGGYGSVQGTCPSSVTQCVPSTEDAEPNFTCNNTFPSVGSFSCSMHGTYLRIGNVVLVSLVGTASINGEAGVPVNTAVEGNFAPSDLTHPTAPTHDNFTGPFVVTGA